MDIIHTDRLELKPMCMDYLYSTHEFVSDPENTKYGCHYYTGRDEGSSRID